MSWYLKGNEGRKAAFLLQKYEPGVEAEGWVDDKREVVFLRGRDPGGEWVLRDVRFYPRPCQLDNDEWMTLMLHLVGVVKRAIRRRRPKKKPTTTRFDRKFLV